MRKLYITYPKFQTVSGKLSWSHYCELLSIENIDERNFYEKECLNSNWSVRELKRQLETSLFERLLLSEGKKNKEKVYELSKDGQILSTPEDVLKEPYVFEFLEVKENKPILEKNLEQKLVKHIEEFLLELGKGFMFVGTQQRITLGNIHYYVDMVFYNKILKCYVLIDLKIGQMKAEYAGQMNMYLNYYNEEINDNILGLGNVILNLIHNKNIKIYILNMPSKKVSSYDEVKFWLKMGWIKIYNKKSA